MGQKGNNFVEYALMLGLVVGIGWGLLGSFGVLRRRDSRDLWLRLRASSSGRQK